MNVREIALRHTIPLVLNVHNQLYYLKNFIETFSAHGFNNIYVMDNQSTYPPLLEYYNHLVSEKKATVIYYGKNMGPHYFFIAEIYRQLFESTPFLYSDPDLHYPDLDEHFLSRLFDISKRFQVFKVGSALTLPDMQQIKNPNLGYHYEGVDHPLLEWEAQFWKTPFSPGIYSAPIDTTLHLFNTELYRQGSALITGLRVAGPGFEAVHLPWFSWDPCPADETDYYRRNASWSNWV